MLEKNEILSAIECRLFEMFIVADKVDGKDNRKEFEVKIEMTDGQRKSLSEYGIDVDGQIESVIINETVNIIQSHYYDNMDVVGENVEKITPGFVISQEKGNIVLSQSLANDVAECVSNPINGDEIFYRLGYMSGKGIFVNSLLPYSDRSVRVFDRIPIYINIIEMTETSVKIEFFY